MLKLTSRKSVKTTRHPFSSKRNTSGILTKACSQSVKVLSSELEAYKICPMLFVCFGKVSR